VRGRLAKKNAVRVDGVENLRMVVPSGLEPLTSTVSR
jgi:hypothetical protein